MKYERETDKYLVDNVNLYDDSQKESFDEICNSYNLLKTDDGNYISIHHNITITTKKPNTRIVAYPTNVDSFLANDAYKKLYEFMRSYVNWECNKMELIVHYNEIYIYSLKGLIQFLDLLEFDKATTNIPVVVLKKELCDYKRRLTKY